jgi:hypothetical protein
MEVGAKLSFRTLTLHRSYDLAVHYESSDICSFCFFDVLLNNYSGLQTMKSFHYRLGSFLGFCQDHAQALIACARHAGFPARYVAGYLFSSEDGTPHEASHAWAELHVPGYGWIGFDPANRCCPDERYIRLGSGLDAAEAAPIKGIARGLGAESLSVTVAIQSQAQ